LLGRQLVLTQAATAKILGIRQPKVSELLRGRLDGFSTDRLVRFITLLGYDVQIKLTKTRAHTQGHMEVTASKIPR
jgi:predicted XRE-type DNA-binding protein